MPSLLLSATVAARTATPFGLLLLLSHHRTHTMHVTRKYMNGNGSNPNTYGRPLQNSTVMLYDKFWRLCKCFLAQLVMTVYGCPYDAQCAERRRTPTRACMHHRVFMHPNRKPNSHDVFEPASARTDRAHYYAHAYNSLPAAHLHY